MPSELRLKLTATLFGRASNVAMVAIAAAVCGASAWVHVHSVLLLAISILEVALLLTRCLVIVRFQRAERDGAPLADERWLALFCMLAVTSSCCWGAMCFFAFATAVSPIVYMLPIICTVGTAGATAARNSGVPRLARAQLGCSLLPLTAGCALAPDSGFLFLLLLVPAMGFGLLVLVSERHAQLVELIETQAELRRLSNTDALTQIANRRAFDLELQSACKPGAMVSLLMIDVDRFKSFNDRHGHLEGDILLTTIAATLQRALEGRRDRVFRFGGEEFSVLLAGVEPSEAHDLSERLRLVVAAHCCDPVDHIPITISIGLAHVVDGDAKRLLTMADKALYAAKNSGRNRVFADALPTAA